MGINGLFGFVKPYIRKEQKIKCVLGKKVGIDIFWFMHKCLGNLDKLHNSLMVFIETCDHAIFVFDGKVSEERKPELKILTEKRKKKEENLEILYKLDMSEMSECEKNCVKKRIEELKIQAWAPRSEFIEKVKLSLKEWWGDKSEIIIAPYEADLYFGELEKSGRINCILSNDSDMLALGYSCVIRPETDGDGFVKIYNMHDILSHLHICKKDWYEFIEFCKINKGKDLLVLYSIWRVYYNSVKNSTKYRL